MTLFYELIWHFIGFALTANLTNNHSLSYRKDNIDSFLFFKIFIITIILLVMTYIILRIYSQYKKPNKNSALDVLVCTSALRLSTKTKAYILKTGAENILVVETATGVSMIKLADSAKNQHCLEESQNNEV